MELFAVLPDRFFSILASPAKVVYAHVLFLIYDLHKQELYGTPREAVVDAAAAYLETELMPSEELGEGGGGAGVCGVLVGGVRG